MLIKVLHLLILGIISFDIVFDVKAVSDGVPLFHIERSRDADKIMYVLNLLPDGSFDSRQPISAHWLRNDKDGKPYTEPLTSIQEKFGYGTSITAQTNETIVFFIRAIADKQLTTKKDKADKYRTFTSTEHGEIILDSMFIQFTNDSFWRPLVGQIDLFGYLAANGNKIKLTLKP